MLTDLLTQNTLDRPEKARILDRMRGRVAIVVEDAGVAVTLLFEGGKVRVHDGIVGIPDLTIRAGSEHITKMSLMELLPKVGLPDPRGAITREIFQASKDGRIRMFGAVQNLPTVVRLTKLLSIN